jgi:hypothetical protein
MRRSQRVWSVVLGAALVLTIAESGAAQFREMAARVPQSANALVLLNVKEIFQSPKAAAEGWKGKFDKAFDAGLARIPPGTERYVIASEIDFEFMKPIWEAAVIDFAEAPSLEQIAKARLGTPDKLGDVPAFVLPTDAYVLQLGPKTFGAISPANRQQATRWVRQMEGEKSSKLSEYLRKGAAYSDSTGTEVIMVLDLDGVFPPERVLKYLKTKKALDAFPGDRVDLAKLVASMDGIRVGVRIGEKLTGKISLDFSEDPAKAEPFAKGILLEALSDAGMRIEDLESWKPEVKGMTVSLSGELTSGGLRKLLSVVEAPAAAEDTDKNAAEAESDPKSASPGDVAANQAKATLRYFQSVTKFLGDLKNDMRDLKTMGQSAVWCDKYARKIEKLPLLGVDPEMLDYGKFVATSLRGGALDTRNTTIDTAAAQTQVAGAGSGAYNPGYYGGYGYGRGAYGGGWYGGGNVFGARAAAGAAVREQGHEKVIIRTQARGDIASNLQSIKTDLAQVTLDVRRKMTERYHIEF